MIKMLMPTLDQISLFQGLSPVQTSLLQSVMEPCEFLENTVVFEQGEAAQYLYVLVRGEVSVSHKAYDGPVITIAHVCAGGIFGWSSALGHPTYTSRAICAVDCQAYRITGRALHHLCNQNPDSGLIILERLADVIAERLSSTHSQVLEMLTQSPDSNGECLRRISRNGRQ
jgi:CRP-like cAMP-binding protein